MRKGCVNIEAKLMLDPIFSTNKHQIAADLVQSRGSETKLPLNSLVV